MISRSWGRTLTVKPDCVKSPAWIHEIDLHQSSPRGYLACGFGKSYGDSCLTPGTQILTKGLNKILSWNKDSGILHCEAGASLSSITALTLPDGWFLPVSPGTAHVSVGGAVANDVHGKNHHRDGSFGHHVRSLNLMRSDRSPVRCGPEEDTDLFRATVGGLGLTGLITDITLQMKKVQGASLRVKAHFFESLAGYLELSGQLDPQCQYSVAWSDFTHPGRGGRGVYWTGEHHAVTPVRKAPGITMGLPFEIPFRPLTDSFIRMFNEFYYFLQRRKEVEYISSPEGFFYPLDRLGSWNRIYGPGGFYQYQCVIPLEAGKEAFLKFSEKILTASQKPYLSVIKTFGDKPPAGLLSFPLPGYTLALDYPAKGQETLNFLKELDQELARIGGRIYPAKDARMSGSFFQSSYPCYKIFNEFKDPAFSSHFWKRVRHA